MTTYARPGVFVNTSLTPLLNSPGGTGGAVACFAAAYKIGPTSPTLVTSWQQYVNLFGSFAQAAGSPLAYAVYQYFNNGGNGCFIYRVPNTDAAVASVAIGSVEETTGGTPAPVDTSLLTFQANNPGAWANKLYVEIVPGAPASTTDPTSVFTVNVYNGGTTSGSLVETWPAVSLNPSSSRNLLALMNATAGGSNYVTAKVNFTGGAYVAGDGSSDPVGNSGTPTALAGGADGSTAPALDTAITSGLAGPSGAWSSPGLGVLTNVILNLNMPGITEQSTLNNVISWAETAGNVFVVIDAPFGGVPLLASSTLVQLYQQFLSSSGTAINAASVAAVYGPWLSIKDPASASSTATRWVAPGGAVLGVWARSDAQHNIAKTPAGTTATVSANALEAYWTTTDLNSLETAQINPIKLLQGSGFCIFGGRTLATGYPNRYINISRTLMQFTMDFVNITQFAIFQNNDAALWQSISTVLTSYLMQAMQANMLSATTPSDAFQVICDGTTTSAAQAQAGIVNATVAVALVSPAEFIIINLSQMSGGGSATVTSS
jgi:hypothetical protein